ncbi:MAG: hypothetical protein FWG31_04545 [Oscillospiraceae bacterium]|nr:hypothetical protein [Oscillospiraceae bacterium]
MPFSAGGMTLGVVHKVFSGSVNDVAVCRDYASPLEMYYTLIVIKDRNCAKQMLAALQKKRSGDGVGEPYISCFSHNAWLCYLFPYRPERPIGRFAATQITGPAQWEMISMNLVMECLSSHLPYPLLALTLESGNVHVEKDGAVYFSYCFDLSELNPDDDERACARRCAEMALALPRPGSNKVKSARLMNKKLARNAYRGLSELYRDVKVSAIPPEKPKFTKRLSAFWQRNKDVFFRFLLVFCVIILVFAVVIGLMQLIFGSIPLFRLFENTFGRIGTLDLS